MATPDDDYAPSEAETEARDLLVEETHGRHAAVALLELAVARASVALACMRWQPPSALVLKELADAEATITKARTAFEACVTVRQRLVGTIIERERADRHGQVQ